MKWTNRHDDEDEDMYLKSSTGENLAVIYGDYETYSPSILPFSTQPLHTDPLNDISYTWDDFRNRFGVDYTEPERLKSVIEHFVSLYGYV